MVPHVFASCDLEYGELVGGDLSVRSVCCGPDVSGGEPIKSGWNQPFPCFMGWHTTDADAAKEQYNGVNVLRCDPGPGGKCQRKGMKHHAHYRHLFDDQVKHNQIDKEDRKKDLKRKKEEMEKGYDAYDLDYMGGEMLWEDAEED